MSDSIYEGLVRFVVESTYQTIVVPDEIHEAISKKSQKVFVPYIGAAIENLESYDLIAVHKGKMNRLGFQLLSAISFQLTPAFANEVYVCYVKQPALIEASTDGLSSEAVVEDAAGNPVVAPTDEEVSASATSDKVPEFMKHVPPVRNYMYREPFLPPKANKLKSAVLVSAFGVGNIGDDLVSYAAKKMLEDVGVADVTMAGPSVSYEAICAADVVAIGGGGLFYDSDIVNCANYLYPIQEAARQSKPSVVLGVGIQGITTNIGKSAYGRHLQSATYISVRDPQDKSELVAIEPSLERTFAGADMAFYMADELRRIANPFAVAKPLALFSLSSILEARLKRQGHDLRAEVARRSVQTLREQGYDVLLVLHSEDDRAFFKWLAEAEQLKMIESASFGLAATARLYASASLVVTSRFHALILGVIFGKAVVSLYGETAKTAKLISSYLPSIQGSCQLLDRFNIKDLLSKLRNAEVVKPEEVDRCVAMTHLIRAELATAIEKYRAGA